MRSRKHRPSRNDVFRLPHIGHDLGDRIRVQPVNPARANDAPWFEEPAARETVEPFGSAFGKLAVQHLLKLFAAASSSRLRQYSGPVASSSPFRTAPLPSAGQAACACLGRHPYRQAFRRVRFVLVHTHLDLALSSQPSASVNTNSIERAPHRWQVLQLVISLTDRTLYASFKALPSAI